jgi:hypothetical protein
MEAICPKHRLTFNGLHGVISQKIVLFITAVVQNVKSCITYVVVTGLRNVKLFIRSNHCKKLDSSYVCTICIDKICRFMTIVY